MTFNLDDILDQTKIYAVDEKDIANASEDSWLTWSNGLAEQDGMKNILLNNAVVRMVFVAGFARGGLYGTTTAVNTMERALQQLERDIRQYVEEELAK